MPRPSGGSKCISGATTTVCRYNACRTIVRYTDNAVHDAPLLNYGKFDWYGDLPGMGCTNRRVSDGSDAGVSVAETDVGFYRRVAA